MSLCVSRRKGNLVFSNRNVHPSKSCMTDLSINPQGPRRPRFSFFFFTLSKNRPKCQRHKRQNCFLKSKHNIICRTSQQTFCSIQEEPTKLSNLVSLAFRGYKISKPTCQPPNSTKNKPFSIKTTKNKTNLNQPNSQQQH